MSENHVEMKFTTTMKGARLESIRISLLDANPVQPPLRSTDKAISGLKDRVLKSYIITPILVVQRGERFVIVDGHRRHAVALSLGLSSIYAIVLLDVDPIDGFIDLGYGTQNFKGSTWFTIWAKSGDDKDERLKRCSDTIRQQIARMVRVFGRGRAMDLGVEGKTSPGAADLILRLHKRLSDADVLGSVTLAEIGEWVLKYKYQRAIEDQMKVGRGYNKQTCKEIVSWIKNDTPGSGVWAKKTK